MLTINAQCVTVVPLQRKISGYALLVLIERTTVVRVVDLRVDVRKFLPTTKFFAGDN